MSDASHMPPATQHTGEEVADGFQRAGFMSPGLIHLHLGKVCLLIEHRAEIFYFPLTLIALFFISRGSMFSFTSPHYSSSHLSFYFLFLPLCFKHFNNYFYQGFFS